MTDETEPHQPNSKSSGLGRQLRVLLITVVSIVLLIIIACGGAYFILERGGAFSAKKCAENGGRWDDAIEICHFD